MELSLRSSLSHIQHEAQNLTTSDVSSLMSSDPRQNLGTQMQQIQQTDQLLLSTSDHNGGHIQLNGLQNNTDSLCESSMDPSTSSELLDHPMISVSDVSQTTISQHVRIYNPYLMSAHISMFQCLCMCTYIYFHMSVVDAEFSYWR